MIPIRSLQQVERGHTTNTILPQQFQLIAKASSSLEQRIKQRGLRMVENKTMWETPVKIEFNIDKKVLEYNVREQEIQLLTKMNEADNAMKVKSTVDSSVEWTNLKLLPEDEDFTKHFLVKEFGYRKVRKVVVYMNLSTSIHINRIKYRVEVKEFIFNNNIWFKPDRFETNVESSPGVVTMIHPRLVNREKYKAEMMSALSEAMEYITEPGNESHEVVNSTTETEHRERKILPAFYLESSIKKWRDLKVEVLRVNCAKDDSEFLKLLLATSSEKGLLQRGVFVPEGLHLLEGKELVYTILLKHDQYLQTVIGVPLRGLASNKLTSIVPCTNKTIKDTIVGIEGVLSIERLRDRSQNGNWLILTNKQQYKYVLDQLEKNMNSFYQSQTGQARLILVGDKRIKSLNNRQNRVMTYAEILAMKFKSDNSLDGESPDTTGHSKTKGDITNDTLQKSEIHRAVHSIDKDTVTLQQAPTQEKTEARLNNDLIQKLAEIEEKQSQMIQEQVEFIREQKRENKSRDKTSTQTETNSHEEVINELLDKRMAKFEEVNTNRLDELETTIKKDISESFDTKVKTISCTVANQVASQLMVAIKQYMSFSNQQEIPTIPGRNAPSMITQEGMISPGKKAIENTENSVHRNRFLHGSDNSKMLAALNEIEPNTNKPCSTHDNNSEQSMDPC